MSKSALLIGNSIYKDQYFAKLRTPAQDVNMLGKILADPKIGGFQVKKLIDEPHYKVSRKIQSFINKTKHDDMILLYFSGHGAISYPKGQLYFAFTDTEFDLLESTAIPSSFIAEQMDKRRSTQQIIILDCCYSGRFESKDSIGYGRNVGSRFSLSGPARAVLTATDTTSYAFEGEQLHGSSEASLFTGFLIKGLKGGVESQNGWITIDALYDYVYKKVTAISERQRPRKAVAQRGKGSMKIAKHSDAEPSEVTPSKTRELDVITAETAEQLLCLEILLPYDEERITAPEDEPSSFLDYADRAFKALDAWSSEIRGFSFSHDGAILASSHANSVRLWRVIDGELWDVLSVNDSRVTAVAFSPDRTILASGLIDSTIILQRIADGTVVNTLKGHSEGQGHSDESIFDKITGFLEKTFTGITDIVWSPDGRTFASAGIDNTVRVWRASDGELMHTLRGHEATVKSLAWSPDGQIIASVGKDKKVRLWRAQDGTCLENFAESILFSIKMVLDNWQGDYYPTDVSFSPNGQVLAISWSTGYISLLDASEGDVLRRWKGHDKIVSSIAFSPNSRILVSGSYDGTVKLWRVADGKPLSTLSGEMLLVYKVLFSPDGNIIASASADKTIRLWGLQPSREA